MSKSATQLLSIPGRLKVHTWFSDPLPRGSFDLPKFLKLWDTIHIELVDSKRKLEKNYSLKITQSLKLYSRSWGAATMQPAFIGEYPLFVSKSRMPGQWHRHSAPRVSVYHVTDSGLCVMNSFQLSKIFDSKEQPWEFELMGDTGRGQIKGYPLFPNSNENIQDSVSAKSGHYILLSKAARFVGLYDLAVPTSPVTFYSVSKPFRFRKTDQATDVFDLPLTTDNLQVDNIVGSDERCNLNLFDQVDDIYEYGVQGKPLSTDFEKLYIQQDTTREGQKSCSAFMVRNRHKEDRELIGSGVFGIIEFVVKSEISTNSILKKLKEEQPNLINQIPKKHGIEWTHFSVNTEGNTQIVYELNKKYRVAGVSVRLIVRIVAKIKLSVVNGFVELRQNIISRSVRFEKSTAANILDGLSFNAIDRKLGGVKEDIENNHLPKMVATINSRVKQLNFARTLAELKSKLEIEVNLKERVEVQYLKDAIYPIYHVKITKGLPIDQIYKFLDQDFELHKSTHMKDSYLRMNASDDRYTVEFLD